jgi:hypothetical protein
MTTWLFHPIYSKYEISDDGRIRRPERRQGQELKLFPMVGTDGYLHSSLSMHGVMKNFYIHILVCETFHGLRPSVLHEVRHLNGDCIDNRASNLAWGTRSENAHDKVRHGTHHQTVKTTCPQGHEYDQVNTYIWHGQRHCRACRNGRERARKAALRTSDHRGEVRM